MKQPCDFCFVVKELPCKYKKKKFCSQICRMNHITYLYLEDLKENNRQRRMKEKH